MKIHLVLLVLWLGEGGLLSGVAVDQHVPLTVGILVGMYGFLAYFTGATSNS